MNETPAIGYIIAALTFLATIGGIVARVLWFRSRWDVPLLGGLPVRFERVNRTAALCREIAAANRVVKEVIAERYAYEPELLDYRVIVRPTGTLYVNGKKAHGTGKGERMLPVTEKVHTVIVEAHEAGYLICHEVARHTLPLRRIGDPDIAEKFVEYAAVEMDMKSRLTRALLDPV